LRGRDVVSPTLIAVPVTIVPAMGLLWIMLRRYEGYFEDARVFFSLVAGFFAGIVVAFFEAQFDFAGPDFVASVGAAPAFFLFVAGYAFFEAGGKTVVLGLARFRRRKDTPYYGAAFGLGFGAMVALALVIVALRAADLPEFPDYQVLPFLGLVAVFLGGILAHGGSSVYIARGSAEGHLLKGWLQGAALQSPILVFYWFYWPSLGVGNAVVVLPGLASLAYGAFLFVLADRRILSTIVPPEIRDLVQKERRRALRKERRDD
jgi:hypothetical protein